MLPASLVISSLFVKHYVDIPIGRLIDSMRLLELGNSNAKLHINGSSQMKTLSDSFNLMVERVIVLVDTTAQQVVDLAQAQERSQHVIELTDLNRELELSLTEVRLLNSRQETIFMGTINALVTTIEASDTYTHGHSTRVTNYSMALASRVGLPEERLRILKQAAILHDIGKIGIDKSILHKTGRLDENEMNAMRQHPVIATHILRHIEELEEVQAIVARHHERFDGKGYPFGIGGNDLPIESRILSVADTFDAMTSHRPYRKGLPLEVTINELAKNAGTQFDPQLVDHFIRLVREGELTKSTGDYHLLLENRDEPVFIKEHRLRTCTTPITALIVEDDPLSSLMVRDYFERLGHRIDTAFNASEGVQLFSGSRYDLVLLDIELPDHDGYSVARDMRRIEEEHARNCRTIICALTSSSEQEAGYKVLSSGMNLFMQKPFNSATMMGVIEMTCQASARSQGQTVQAGA